MENTSLFNVQKENNLAKEKEMSKVELYLPYVVNSARNWAYNMAIKVELLKLQCPAFDAGIRWLVEVLVTDNIIDPEVLKEYLDRNSPHKTNQQKWWK